MKIGELARRSGLSPHTLRYYERIGLLPKSPRLDSRHRDYDESTFNWIALLGRLKTTGMSIQQMLAYAALVKAGDATVAERRDLLVAHRERVCKHIENLQACLAVLDTKIANYSGTCERTSHDRTQHPANVSFSC